MQFAVQARQSSARQARLVLQNGRTIDTPGTLAYTHRATLPHLTADLFGTLPPFAALHCSIANASDLPSVSVLHKFGKGIAAFTNLKDIPIYLAIRDVLSAPPDEGNRENAVAVNSSAGRKLIQVQDFVKFVQAYQPDIAVAMCDCVSDTVGNKRAQKAMSRSLNFLEETVESFRTQKLFAQTSLFASIIGGSNVANREKFARDTVEFRDHIDGYVIEGLSMGEDPTSHGPTIEAVVAVLPDEKPRVAHGISHPLSVLAAVRRGVDLFDSGYPCTLTEIGSAMTFSWTATPTLPKIDLWDRKYELDTAPFVSGCQCLACAKYTRAYVHHLLHTHEMLGAVLLMLHNFHHYATFFGQVRIAIGNGSLELFCKAVSDSFAHSDSQ